MQHKAKLDAVLLPNGQVKIKEETITRHSLNVYKAIRYLHHSFAYRFLIQEGLTDEEILEFIKMCAILHDLGKAHISFEDTMDKQRQAHIDGTVYKKTPEEWDRYLRHELIALPYAIKMAEQKKAPLNFSLEPQINEIFNRIAIPVVVGSHHKLYPVRNPYLAKAEKLFLRDGKILRDRNEKREEGDLNDDIKALESAFGISLDDIKSGGVRYISDYYSDVTREVKEVWEKRLEDNHKCDYDSVFVDWEWMRCAQMLHALISLFRYCDWYASSNRNERRLLRKIDKYGLKGNLLPQTVLKRLVKGSGQKYEIRSWEQEIINDDKSNLILCGRTGSGKTLAQTVSAVSGSKKVFLLFPFTIAANFMFAKLMHHETGLLPNLRHGHSTVYFKEVLKEVKDQGENALLFHLAKKYNHFIENYDGIIDVDEEQKLEMISKNENSRAKTFRGFITCCTLDQMCLQFMGSLQGCHLAEYNQEDTTIVIDEVDAYNPYTRYFIKRLIHKMHRCRFIISSATLTKRQVLEIEELLAQPREQQSKRPTKIVSDHIDFGDKPNVIKVDHPGPRYKLRSNFNATVFTELDSIIQAAKTQKVFVQVNTLIPAQNLYDDLRANKVDVVLLTDKTSPIDRVDIEKLIKQKEKDEKPFVLVSTPMANRMLDFDFDRVWLEVCPLNEILQALGRLNRFYKKVLPIALVVGQSNRDRGLSNTCLPFNSRYITVCREILQTATANGVEINELDLYRLNERYDELTKYLESASETDAQNHMIKICYDNFVKDVVSDRTSTHDIFGMSFRFERVKGDKSKVKRQMQEIGRLCSQLGYSIRENAFNQPIYLKQHKDQILTEISADGDNIHDILTKFQISIAWFDYVGIKPELITTVPLNDHSLNLQFYDIPYDPKRGLDMLYLRTIAQMAPQDNN